jgi:hypothetical protein
MPPRLKCSSVLVVLHTCAKSKSYGTSTSRWCARYTYHYESISLANQPDLQLIGRPADSLYTVSTMEMQRQEHVQLHRSAMVADTKSRSLVAARRTIQRVEEDGAPLADDSSAAALPLAADHSWLTASQRHAQSNRGSSHRIDLLWYHVGVHTEHSPVIRLFWSLICTWGFGDGRVLLYLPPPSRDFSAIL